MNMYESGQDMDPRDPGLIRDDMRESLIAYARDGVPTGGFLEAVLANDLVGACERADDGNLRAIVAMAAFVRNELPSLCWGSRRVYSAWVEYHLARRAGAVEREASATEELQAAFNESRARR